MTAGQLPLIPPDRRRIGRVRRGYDQTTRALRDTGRVEPIDDALLALGRVWADQLDDAVSDANESRFVRARCAAVYLDVLRVLRDQTRPDVDALSLDDLFASVDDPAHLEPPY